MRKLLVAVFVALLLPAAGFGNVGNHSLLIKADGSLWSMGLNGYYNLGDGTSTQRTSSVRIADLKLPVGVPIGQAHVAETNADVTDS